MSIVLEAQHVCEPLTGIGYYTLNMIRALLKRRRFEYALSFFDYNREMNNRAHIERYLGEFGVTTHECDTLHYGKASRDDSVFVSMNYNEYTGTTAEIYHFSSIWSIPTRLTGEMVVSVHDMIALMRPDLIRDTSVLPYQVGFNRLKQRTPRAYVLCVSEATRCELIEALDYPEELTGVTYNATDPLMFYPDESAAEVVRAMGIDGEYLLYLGTLEVRKNLDRVIHAFDAIAPRYPGLKLVLAGGWGWKYDAIKEALDASPNRSRIVLPGYVTEEQKRALYSDALATVYASLYEGFGMPILEAMACGCPVITSNISSMPEVAGDAAILADPYSVDHIASAMDTLLSSDALRVSLRERGFTRAGMFSWEDSAREAERVYCRLLGAG